MLIDYQSRCGYKAGLSLTFESPVVFFSTPVANLILCGWMLSITGNFTCSIMAKSSILSHNRCYRLWPLMTALQRYWLTLNCGYCHSTSRVSGKINSLFSFRTWVIKCLLTYMKGSMDICTDGQLQDKIFKTMGLCSHACSIQELCYDVIILYNQLKSMT